MPKTFLKHFRSIGETLGYIGSELTATLKHDLEKQLGPKALDAGEIDDLCERLNTGA